MAMFIVRGESSDCGTGATTSTATAGSRPFYRKLYIQVIIAVLFGAGLGYFFPTTAEYAQPVSDAFIKAIKVVVVPIIFTTVVVGIASMGDIRRVADVGLKALIYFEVVSTLALLLGMLVGNVWQVGAGLHADPSQFDATLVDNYAKVAKNTNISNFFMSMIPSSFIEPFVKGDILPILCIGVVLGIALSLAGPRCRQIVTFLDAASVALFGMVRIIMYFAPVAAMCAMASTVGKYGLHTLLDLGELVASVYVVSAIFVVAVLGGCLRLAGFSITKVMGYFKEEILFVFVATSAETMMPRSMQKLEKIGVSKEVVGLVIPAGFSFNMDGTAIYMTMSVLFLAHAFGVHLTLANQASVLFVMLFTSKGAAGVTGGGFIALAATLPVVDSIPIAGLVLLLGADRFMAQIRAATNLTSNIIATLVVGRWVDAVDMGRARNELDSGFIETNETRNWD
jgi:aerobic C4-dicarboxylate transport protein